MRLLWCSLLLLAGCASSSDPIALQGDDASRCIARCEASVKACDRGFEPPASCVGASRTCDEPLTPAQREACRAQQSACSSDRIGPVCENRRLDCLQTCGG